MLKVLLLVSLIVIYKLAVFSKTKIIQMLTNRKKNLDHNTEKQRSLVFFDQYVKSLSLTETQKSIVEKIRTHFLVEFKGNFQYQYCNDSTSERVFFNCLEIRGQSVVEKLFSPNSLVFVSNCPEELENIIENNQSAFIFPFFKGLIKAMGGKVSDNRENYPEVFSIEPRDVTSIRHLRLV